MKILICNKFHFIHGGAERYVFDLSKGLESLGHDIIHFAMKDGRNFHSDYSEYFVNNKEYGSIINKWPIAGINNALGFIYSIEAKRKIERLIDKYKPQVAHIHNIYHQISPSILYSLRKKRIPVVMTLHDYKLICPSYNLFSKGLICEKCKGKNFYHCFLNKCLKDSVPASLLCTLETYFHKALNTYKETVDLFIAPSRFVRDKMAEFGIDRNKVLFVPCALNLKEFTPNFEPGKYIVYFGRLVREKGILTLLKSLKHLPEIPVKILGEGPQRKELESFARKEGLASVDFLGHMPNDKLCKFVRNSLCAVLPSQWYEPAGLNIYEAFACGKAVIASRIGGIPELVEENVNGLLFEPGNYRELAEKIRYLLNNPKKAVELGKNAFESIDRVNNTGIHYQKIIGVYDRAIINYS